MEYLMHYGVKGMKWGVRKTRSSSKTYNEAKNEYDRNSDLIKKYSKVSNKGINPSKNKYYKSVVESDVALTKKTETYLKTLGKTKIKSLMKQDEEHGYYYVDAKLFDPDITYESHVRVSDDFAKRYR